MIEKIGASQSGINQRMTRDHAISGVDLESQLAESINRHFNEKMRDDLIAYNMSDE